MLQELVIKDPSTAAQDWYQYHLRAVNAAIGLQAFALRDIQSRCVGKIIEWKLSCLTKHTYCMIIVSNVFLKKIILMFFFNL